MSKRLSKLHKINVIKVPSLLDIFIVLQDSESFSWTVTAIKSGNRIKMVNDFTGHSKWFRWRLKSN